MTVHIPARPRETLRPSTIIAEGLLNPRGACLQADGSLLLVEAGSGLPEQPFSGRISRLRPDPLHPGAWLARETLAQGFRSMNMQARMLRDEIMGLSDVACGDGRCLVSQTDYVAGSKLLDLQYTPPEPIFHSRAISTLCVITRPAVAGWPSNPIPINWWNSAPARTSRYWCNCPIWTWARKPSRSH